MDIICPQYDVDEINVMTFVIYNVTKDAFESCGKVNQGRCYLIKFCIFYCSHSITNDDFLV